MEDKIFDIITDLLRDDISKTEAIEKLLNLHSVIETKQWLAMQMIETEKKIRDVKDGGVGDNDDALIDSLIGKYEKYEDEYSSL